MGQGCSSIDEKARTNVVKDVQELDKDDKKLVIQNKAFMGMYLGRTGI